MAKARAVKSGRAYGKWALAVLVLLALAAGSWLLPVREWADGFQRWIEDLGAFGFVAFAAVYIVATVLLVPVSVLTVVAGLAFGVVAGFPLVVLSATIGATLAFLVARYWLHDRVNALVGNRPGLKAVNQAISEEGWKIVFLLRLSPVLPFNLQNYFYGVTDVKLVHYVPATFLGILPGTLLYVYLGSAGKAASGEGGGPLQWLFFATGLLATVAVAWFVTTKAKAKLKEIGVEG